MIESGDGEYLGCLYVYPSIAGELAADVVWWWRTGSAASTRSFREHLLQWLASDEWPRLSNNLLVD